MTIPIFEKLSSLFIFIGFGIGLYIIDFNIKSVIKLEEKQYEGSFKILQLKYDRITDSTECVILRRKLNQLNKNYTIKYTDTILSIRMLIAQKLILNIKRNEEIELINSDIYDTNNQLKKDSGYPTIIGIILSAVLITLGIIEFMTEIELKKIESGRNQNSSNRYIHRKK